MTPTLQQPDLWRAVYWEPELEEKVQMVHQMYRGDGLSEAAIRTLLHQFPRQSLDFFGAIRASTYDDQILCAALCRASFPPCAA